MFDTATKSTVRQIAMALLVACGLLLATAATAGAAYTYVNDEDGVNDQPGQKDLTRHGVDPLSPAGTLLVTWNWDDIAVSGANTEDACALFDTDGDFNVNGALCVTTDGDPMAETATTAYSCGDDKADRCTQPVGVINPFTSQCDVAQTNTDPFDPDGDAAPADTTAECDVTISDFGAAAVLVNTCSYPSGQPNSDPSDCVLVPREGFLIIKKVTDPADSTETFNFALDGSQIFAAQGSDTSPTIAVRHDIEHAIAESSSAGWTLTDAECDNDSGSLAGDTLSGISIDAGETVTCTFNNRRHRGTLRVIKHVENDNSGTGAAGDFQLSVESGGADVDGSPAAGSETGTDYTLYSGDYVVSEQPVSGYSATYSGDCDASGNVTIADGDAKTCTITNDDDAHPSIDVQKDASPSIISSGDVVTYTISVDNDGDDPISNLVVSDPDCLAIAYVSGDDVNPNVLDTNETWKYTCSTAVIDDIVNTASAEGQGSEGGSASDSDTAEVDVIHPAVSLTKTPDKSIVAPGTVVVFTISVTNTGDTTLFNLQVTDSLCSSPPAYQSGDTGGDNAMTVGETWIYTCSAPITQNTTNVAVATASDQLQEPVVAQGDTVVTVESPPVQPAATPSVTIPVATRCVSKTLKIRPVYANGSPAQGVLYIDGKRVKTVKKSNPTFTINVSKYKAGKHSVRAVFTYTDATKVTATGRFDKCKARVTKRKKSPTFTG
jgi:uncharacterized repeat protein (TIGR01451 family)